MNRRTITQVLIFLAIVFVGDRIGGEILERIFSRTGYRYAQLYESKLPAEIVVLGNSRGLHMFHPPAIEEITGRKVANLAFNALPPVTMPIIWEDYLKHHPLPKLLVLEVSCISVEDEKGSLERMSILMDKNQAYGQRIKERNATFYWGTQISRLFRYNSSLLWRSLLVGESDQSWIMDSKLNEEMLGAMVEDSDSSLHKVAENAEAIKEVLRLAKEHGVKVKVLIAPYYPRYRDRLTEAEEWIDWVRNEIDVDVEDHSRLLLDPACFADHLHLNEQGARILAEKLNAVGFFDTDD